MTFSPIVLGSGLSGYNFLTRTRETQQATFDKSPVVNRDVQSFKDRIGTVTSAKDLVKDRQLLQVALGAFGLETDINNKAFIERVLDSDLADPRSIANRLGDKRYLAMARTFGFNSPSGAQLPADASKLKLDGIASVEDLLSPLNRSVLKGALSQFGLAGNERNTFFLQQVLDSDRADPTSFVNRLNQPAWSKFADAIAFDNSGAESTPVERFVTTFEGEFDGTLTAGKLVNNKQMLSAATELFGIKNTNPDYLRKILESDPTDPKSLVNIVDDDRLTMFSQAFRFGWPELNDLTDADDLLGNDQLLAAALKAFDVSNPGKDRLRNILNSDLGDPASVANQAANAPWRAMAEAFQAADWPEIKSPAHVFVDKLADDVRNGGLKSGLDVAFDLGIYRASMEMFGRKPKLSDTTRVLKLLDADLSADVSALTFEYDQGLKAMAQAFAFNTGKNGPGYPEGFADAITRNYLDRQFEVRVGETDSNMRLALSLERELNTVVSSSGGTDARIYGLLGSGPLRKVFETAFQLPSSFANIDIDQQHKVFKDRMERQFGVKNVADFLKPEKLEELRSRFLTFGGLAGSNGGVPNPVVQLLGGF